MPSWFEYEREAEEIDEYFALQEKEAINDCECEELPLFVYCKKCGKIYLITTENERVEISPDNEVKIMEVLKSEMKDNNDLFVEKGDDYNE